VSELLALAKSKPGVLNYASPGNGSLQHLAFELFKQETGIDIVHVPYKSTGPAYNDLVGGRVNAMITTINTSVPYVQNGKMRLLAVLSEERSSIHPSTPTFKESGVSGLEVYTWNAMLGPLGLPAEVLRRLNAEVNAILELKDVSELLAKQGLKPVGGSPSRLGELLKREMVRWQRVVTVAGIKAD
jgi:tripartite-type tricarboxylate transporter receptor subunit TctC